MSLQMACGSYVDFKSVVGVIPVNRYQVFYQDLTATAQTFIVGLVADNGHWLVTMALGSISSPPATFSTDFPAAISLPSTMPNNNFVLR